jgi:KipI family sensor histidine kinase inhibitor
MSEPRLLPCGDTGLLVELPGLDDVLALHRHLREQPPPGTVDLVPAARTLLVRVEPGADLAAVARAVRSARPEPGAGAAEGDDVEVPVVYDGEDLDDVARHTGLDVGEVVRAHTEQVWTVAFAGFAPGFGYLVGEHERLAVPRRESPRTKVPAGAVALAGAFCGVYPRTSPGGWQLIGRTELAVWDLDRDPAALLRPGTRVRFVEKP